MTGKQLAAKQFLLAVVVREIDVLAKQLEDETRTLPSYDGLARLAAKCDRAQMPREAARVRRWMAAYPPILTIPVRDMVQ